MHRGNHIISKRIMIYSNRTIELRISCRRSIDDRERVIKINNKYKTFCERLTYGGSLNIASGYTFFASSSKCLKKQTCVHIPFVRRLLVFVDIFNAVVVIVSNG